MPWIRPFNLLVLALASFRLAHLLVFDRITDFIRDPFLKKELVTDEHGAAKIEKKPANKLGYLLTCYWCTGIWTSAALVGLRAFSPRIGRPVVLVLAVAGAQSLMEAAVRFSLRTGRYLEKEAEKVSDEQEAQIVLPVASGTVR
jgi:hypothetical protein